ncbi:MAG TPA: lantibiotic dehydratase [Streptosporangiaceae bacterium]|nr:lantibiotic dehydratase [Streptosporangiaceae bacterium]
MSTSSTTHLRLPGSEWQLWRPVAVRSAGFRAADISLLSAPGLGAHADRLLDGAKPGGQELSAFRDAFASATVGLARQVRDLVGQPRFRSALTWQNHHVLRRGVLQLLQFEPGVHARTEKYRRREELVASYWQRYCLKNDSIGFFGPVGWGHLSAGPTFYEPGPVLVSSRDILFETWPIDRLAEALAADPGLTGWLAPRRLPFVRVEVGPTGEHSVVLPGQPGRPVRPLAGVALRQCDGTIPAIRLAASIVADGHATDPGEVLDVLDELKKKRWITWALDVPISSWPERHLRRSLSEIGEPGLREAALQRLDALERGRELVDAAGDDPDRLLAALEGLDQVFSDLTESATSRHHGQAYGGRTLIYHDSQRPMTLEIGTEVLAALAPLRLVLTSARWLTYQMGLAVAAEIRAIYDRLAARQAGPVTLALLWFEAMSFMHDGAQRELDRLVRELQARWADVIDTSAHPHRISLRAAELDGPVTQKFDAPGPGWLAAMHISPDLMLAARDVDAINRGDFQAILGETHLAIATIRHNCFITQHPAPSELLACLDADMPAPRLLTVLPKEGHRLNVRTHPGLIRDLDYSVAFFRNTADPHRPRLLMSSDLRVDDGDGQLIVRLPDGTTTNVLDAFSEALMDLVVDSFKMFAPAEHTPRVNIDRLVVCRETWRFDPAALTFADEKDEALRYLGTRRWQRETGLQRHVFVKSPREVKPFFVDFDSPIYVNIFCKSVRRLRDTDTSGQLVVTEMLPDLDELWLTDADGQRYTCELRMIATRPPGP